MLEAIYLTHCYCQHKDGVECTHVSSDSNLSLCLTTEAHEHVENSRSDRGRQPQPVESTTYHYVYSSCYHQDNLTMKIVQFE